MTKLVADSNLCILTKPVADTFAVYHDEACFADMSIGSRRAGRQRRPEGYSYEWESTPSPRRSPLAARRSPLAAQNAPDGHPRLACVKPNRLTLHRSLKQYYSARICEVNSPISNQCYLLRCGPRIRIDELKVMQGEIQKVLLVATLALGSALGVSVCQHRRSWWDRRRGECVPCSPCIAEDGLVVRYPCEVYRDTVCQTLAEANSNVKDSESDYEYYESADYGEVSESAWDLQTSTLTLAVSGCVVFFVVLLFVWLYHAKQWRILKRALESDVQDLSAKLKLMEAGGDTPVEPVVPTDHHIYCNIHAGKDALLGRTSMKTSNVYTQDKH